MSTRAAKKKTILIIDDNADILFVMKRALELKAYGVHISKTFTGIEEIKKIAPHLIYLDISLSGQNGREVAQELKKDKGTKNIPIIIITGHADAKEMAREAGADDYLYKPFELDALWKMTAKYTS